MCSSLLKATLPSDTERLAELSYHQTVQWLRVIMMFQARVWVFNADNYWKSLTVHPGRITVTDEMWFARVDSFSTSGREDAFRTGVRNRDGKCVISGAINLLSQANMWPGFEAAHIFPRGYENLWTQFGYGRWITNMDDATGVSKIDSVQNGLLMSGTLHTCFDQYLFSVNPDVGIPDIESVAFFHINGT